MLTQRIDSTGQDAWNEPGVERHYTQHHRRSNISSRFVGQPGRHEAGHESSLLMHTFHTGYWMPFHCARAVCATFCHSVAGALIPIFGASFLSECTQPDAPNFQRMVINPQIVAEAKKEADLSRRMQLSSFTTPSTTSTPGTCQKMDRRPLHPMAEENRRLRLNTSLSPLSTDTDDSYPSNVDSASSPGSGVVGVAYEYRPTPRMSLASGWTAANRVSREVGCPPDEITSAAHPWLSAVPRYPRANSRQPHPPPGTSWVAKRHLDQDDSGYGAGGSYENSPALSFISEKLREEEPGVDQTEKNAALMLMRLSVQDQERERLGRRDDFVGPDSHRSKRRRATPTCQSKD
jgi:hypothetical protein